MAKSDLVTWSSTLSVGIKLIDKQHKGLIKLTNDLFHHCIGDEKSEREYFKKIIGKVIEYVKNHFPTEEKIMLATKFSGYPEHKREHDAFIIHVLEEVDAFNEGKNFNLFPFTKFLKEWILTHIAISDKNFFEHFKKIATRNADGTLSIPIPPPDTITASTEETNPAVPEEQKRQAP